MAKTIYDGISPVGDMDVIEDGLVVQLEPDGAHGGNPVLDMSAATQVNVIIELGSTTHPKLSAKENMTVNRDWRLAFRILYTNRLGIGRIKRSVNMLAVTRKT